MNNLYKGSSAPTSAPLRRGRPPMQRQLILDDLRRQIARGDLAPGDRLPSHHDLIKRYSASWVTIQRAMKVLDQEGCIRSVPGQGRFVAETPAARYRFGIVFPGYPERAHSNHWTRLFAAQLAAAMRFDNRGAYQWEPWFNVDRTDDGGYTIEHDRLMDAVRERRLAGLFFATSAHYLGDSPLLDQHTVPMVTTAMQLRLNPPPPTVSHDVQSFISLVVDQLLRLRRRRVAWLTVPRISREVILEEVRRVGRSGDVTVRPEWVAPVDPYHPDWLEHALGVLMRGAARRRPNAIVVRDDHLLEPALRALETLGVAVPDDVAVVGHWNFPLALESDVPVDLVGFDATEQLARVQEILAGNSDASVMIPACTAATFHNRGGQSVPLAALHDPRISPSVSVKGGDHVPAATS